MGKSLHPNLHGGCATVCRGGEAIKAVFFYTSATPPSIAAAPLTEPDTRPQRASQGPLSPLYPVAERGRKVIAGVLYYLYSSILLPRCTYFSLRQREEKQQSQQRKKQAVNESVPTRFQISLTLLRYAQRAVVGHKCT